MLTRRTPPEATPAHGVPGSDVQRAPVFVSVPGSGPSTAVPVP